MEFAIGDGLAAYDSLTAGLDPLTGGVDGGFCVSLNRENSDLLACSFRARAAPESNLKSDPLGGADGAGAGFEGLLVLPLSGVDEYLEPEPAV